MKAIAAMLALALLAALPAGAGPARAAGPPGAEACPAAEGLGFVCGVVASEDLAQVPHTPWLVLSGMNAGAPAHLYLVDTRTRAARILFPLARPAIRPDPQLSRDCPGPPDLAKMSTDGLNIRSGRNSTHLLYVANHGDRHAVEMFRIDARGATPVAVWEGCAPMPPHTLANAVAPLPDGGVLVTSFHDPDDKDAWTRMARGEPTGSLLRWTPGQGFRRVEAGAISGANGVEVSADGRWAYVSAWSGRAILVLDLKAGGRRTIPVDFLPDNIKRAPDGSLFVGGQDTSVQAIATCQGPVCPQPWIVARVDPRTGRVTPLLARPGSALVSYACGAVQVGGALYITARADGRLITVPLAELPSLR